MKNKILTISIVFILISFIFINNNIFASEINDNSLIVDGYDMSDAYNYFTVDDAFVIVHSWGTQYYLVVPNSPGYTAYCAISSTNAVLYYNENWNELSGHAYTFYLYNPENLKFEYAWTGNTGDWTLDNGALIFGYASKGVYNQDHTTFFMNPPVAEQQEITTLKPILEKVEMKEPIVTTIVGLAKLLIPLLICLLGFWKAWRLLSKILHKS